MPRRRTQPRAPRTPSARPLIRLLLATLAALVVVGLTPGLAEATPKPPPPPTNAQINAARAQADSLTAQVAQLSAQLQSAAGDVVTAQEDAAIALDDYQQKQAAAEQAKSASDVAQASAGRAAADLQTAQDQVAAFARHSYIDGSTYPGAASLLTASGPAQLAERLALLNAAGSNRTDVLGAMTVAQHQSAQSAAAAQTALGSAAALEQQAASALNVASAAERSARQQQDDLAARQADLSSQLAAAQNQLTTLIGAKAAADRLARQQAAAAAAAAKVTPSSVTGPALTGVVTTPAGSGSASAAQKAIAAAKAYLGTRYAWGGGGSAGPSHGVDIDANVVGFDCSGLTQYAYARAGVAIPRNSHAQYASLKKVAKTDLQAGDLVFWAVDPGNPATIHHVALYLGNNQVIQAPESGDVVKISTMWWTGYAGAVRPSA